MSKSGDLEKIDEIKTENARVGYQVAVDFWTYQGQLNWNRFSVMLVANSVVIAVIGAVLSSQYPLPYLITVLALVGLGLCVAWTLLTARGFDYHKYWGLCAQELEKQYFSDALETVSKLGTFSRGDIVDFKTIGETHQFGWLSRVSQRRVADAVIVAFAVLYVAAIVFQ